MEDSRGLALFGTFQIEKQKQQKNTQIESGSP